MTSLASERSWLLDPSVLKLVHQCRRLIHTEFGVKLHLTEEHLDQQLADYARKTRSSQLTRVWETLKERVPQLNIEPEEEDEMKEKEVEDVLDDLEKKKEDEEEPVRVYDDPGDVRSDVSQYLSALRRDTPGDLGDTGTPRPTTIKR